MLAAVDLKRVRNNTPVRVAGCVICRQRPGTANGFMFLSLEDETGIANAIVEPDNVRCASAKRWLRAPYLLVEGILQNQQGAISVKMRDVEPLAFDAARRRFARFPVKTYFAAAATVVHFDSKPAGIT